MARLLTLGDYPNIMELRIQFTSEQDIFFSMNFNCDLQQFDIMRINQQLPCKFQEFATYVMKLLNNLHVESEKLTGQITIYTESKSQLVIRRRTEFKQIELLCLDLIGTPYVECQMNADHTGIANSLSIPQR